MIVFCSWQRSLVYQNRQWKSDCAITIWYKADKTAFFTHSVQFLLNAKSIHLIISWKSRKKCHFRGHNLINFTVHYMYNKGEEIIELYWYRWLFITKRKKCEVDLWKTRSVLSGKVERLSSNSKKGSDRNAYYRADIWVERHQERFCKMSLMQERSALRQTSRRASNGDRIETRSRRKDKQ